MYETIKFIHSYWAYLTLLLIVLATLNALKGVFTKGDFLNKDYRISLFALIVTHIQIVIGVILYMLSPLAMGAIKEGGMGSVMKDSLLRYFSIEHPLMMIIAAVLITIGYSKHKKKETSTQKFRTIAIFYTIALILVLSRIPWNSWFNY
jgi:heme A synthase